MSLPGCAAEGPRGRAQRSSRSTRLQCTSGRCAAGTSWRRALGLALDDHCAAEHVRVSFAGRPRGFVDEALAARERGRRVVLTVSQFATAARVVHDSDLLSVLAGAAAYYVATAGRAGRPA